MNKKLVNEMIPYAITALNEVEGIVNNGIINRTFRSHISSFGAAVATGSLKTAVLFFNQDGNASVKRSQLNKAIFHIIKQWKYTRQIEVSEQNLFDYVNKTALSSFQLRQEVLSAAVALKLAMNVFVIEKEKSEE